MLWRWNTFHMSLWIRRMRCYCCPSWYFAIQTKFATSWMLDGCKATSTESTKWKGRARIAVILPRSFVINYILLDLYGKRERIVNPASDLRDRSACSNIRYITSIFYCDENDSYHLPRRHVWTIRQSVNWYKDMYNRTIWKPFYCSIFIPMTFVRLSSYCSRTRSILLVWRQNENILLNTIPFSDSAMVYYRISVG